MKSWTTLSTLLTMNLSLNGKHALVCGSSRGIGRATAVALAGLGARVTMLARTESELASATAQLPVAEHQQHGFLVADFNEPASVQNAVHAMLARNGPVHILVNNSGGPRAGEAMGSEVSDFERAFANHLVCNHVLARLVAPGMKSAAYGRIINIVSTSVREPIRGLGVSNTIRAAVAGWAKTLSVELGSFGITVNNILPGATRTERLDSIIETKSKQSGDSPERVEEKMLAEIPAGRFGLPEEIADAVAFLASPAAGYISGVSLAVDGGRMRSI